MPRQGLIAAIATAVVAATGAMLFAKESPPPRAPDKLIIDKCKRRYAGVELPHKQHAGKLAIACKQCHHTGKPKKSCAASKCHGGKARGKVPGCLEISRKKNPYHIACVGCHKRKLKGPTKCKQCHRKGKEER